MGINLGSKSQIEYILTNDYPTLYNAMIKILSDGREAFGIFADDCVNFVRDGVLPGVEDQYGNSYPGPASNIIIYDKNDSFAIYSWTQILAYHATGSTGAPFSEAASAYSAMVKAKSNQTLDATDQDAILKHFALSNDYFYSKPENSALFCRLAAERLRVSHKYFREDGNALDFEEIEKIEKKYASEEDVISDPTTTDSGSVEGGRLLAQIATKAYSTSLGQINGADPILQMSFGNRFRGTSATLTVNAFYRAFSKINPEVLSENGLSSNSLAAIISKMQESGILELASYAYEISNFAKKRLRNKDVLQRSLYNSDGISLIVEETDVIWLTILASVVQKLRRDPVTFANISFYFPSLVTFLLDALAVTGDYTNNGKGGGDDTADAFINSLERAFGMTDNGRAIFQMAFKTSNTSNRINRVLTNSPFRRNIAPASPDIFHLRLGAANFYVPPVSIDVNSAFKTGSLTGGAIRQKNSPKFNAGYRETTIRMRLFFPNYEEIWGIKIDEAASISVNDDYEIDFKVGGASEEKIDKFLSSLRGLVAAFKYSPILPIKNDYLNRVHKITGVGLSNMAISTIPNFPFTLAVDIELINFNHNPFLPMIKDFNQAIHWGKYRQYMGKAAGAIHRYVNESFLLKTSDSKVPDPATETVQQEIFTYESYADEGQGSGLETLPEAIDTYQNDVFKFNIAQEWQDGNHIVLYVPAETQTKIFLPDTSSFRSEQEKLFTDLGTGLWDSLLKRFEIDINDSASYGISLNDVVDISESNSYSKSTMALIKDSIDLLTAGVNADTQAESAYLYLARSFVQQNENKMTSEEKKWILKYDNEFSQYPAKAKYNFNSLILGLDGDGISLNQIKLALKTISKNPVEYLNWIADEKVRNTRAVTGVSPDREKVKEDIRRAFNVSLYERFFKSGPIQSLMETARQRSGNFRFNEWEVPMLKVEFDKNSVIVNGVSVNMANNFAKLQLQMQDEPTYQHIGGKDSYINISMTFIGETELIKFKNMFDHISGLARLEHATGVIGFLGIKNIITALSGIKYVLPLNYRVSTVPNYPHVYSVELSLIDFDIFQQTREKLSNKQQKELISHFGKRNPFLRIKQLWAAFNAYPDFPLEVKDENGDTVGHLDPDFYFRSFEMFDRDVINNISDQRPRVQDYSFDNGVDQGDIQTVYAVSQKILEFLRSYRTIGVVDSGPAGAGNLTLQQLINQMIEYYRSTNLSYERFMTIFNSVVATTTEGFTTQYKQRLLTDFINLSSLENEENAFLLEINPAPFQQGDLSPNAMELRKAIEAMLSGEYSIPEEEFVSFDPDDVDFHKLIHVFPAADEKSLSEDKVPATCITALGTYFGYVDSSGRFYLTINGTNVTKNGSGNWTFQTNLMEDTQTPDRGNDTVNTGVPGVVPISEYQKPYDSGSLYAQMEKTMVDTQYRDVSGRMLRAFPTYMLWLIDEGGYFAGVKLFDNFYGLQSIIDFSVVSSEDLLGDTLILRVSNMYSKLTTPESSKIFNPNLDTSDDPSLSDSLTSIIDRTLNISRNILAHMRNEYVVDIANIRLKPGVRVHLRAGYGSNPNSLQTVFNGVITNVEPGEIVTITAQSDAIELGAIVNSTDKKGDSGKIDGGINTGLWLSEPRDLMVRLLTMGASRFREGLSRAYRGMIFSENRFGIRHFGSIVYEPLNKSDAEKTAAIRDNITSAVKAAGSNSSFTRKAVDITSGFASNTRGNTIEAIGQLWSNFSAEVDLELFKRNIYPGNGTGIAQFLGGDLDDGWLTVASLTEQDTYNERIDGHLGRLTDIAWNNLVANSQNQNNTTANDTLDFLVRDSALIEKDRAGLVKGGFSAGIAVGVAALTGPVGGIIAGAGLLGTLRGRGGTSIFKTLGLLGANDDDDLPGFDEVSFRAQTYMRTVWDLFQTCARLLPSYIVAVRPFEDRSTVFYGKPHWLYTSGVVPVTTGYPNEERAIDLGIVPPKTRDPDEDLIKILSTINKNSNPLSDYAAFFQSFEPNDTFESIAEQIANSTGVYAPTSRLAGNVLNFYSQPAMMHIDKNGDTLCKMPKTKGNVTVGMHLPIITEPGTIEAPLVSQMDIHRQLDNLPPRYRFPFFSATEELVLDNFPVVESTDPVSPTYNNRLKLRTLEFEFFDQLGFSLLSGSEGQSLTLDTPLNLEKIITEAEIDYFPTSQIVRMPLPNIRSKEGISGEIVLPGQVDEDYSFEYKDSVYGKLTYTEWGAPSSPEDEQFYIAMRWPYKPSNQSIHDEFKAEYEMQNLYGSAIDYKKRKVIVYNPANGRAVVCRPAYFMWGALDDEQAVDGIVSPDAAYFLGIITVNPGEAEVDSGVIDTITDWVRAGEGLRDGPNYEASGFRIRPQAQECYMGFVPDDVPVGVVATSSVPITKFTLVGATTGTPVEDDEERFIIGFGTQVGEDAGLAVNNLTDANLRNIQEGRYAANIFRDSLSWFKMYGDAYSNSINSLKLGGNPLRVSEEGKTYFEAVLNSDPDWDSLSRENLSGILIAERDATPDPLSATRTAFMPVWSPIDMVGVGARRFYDEGYDESTNVIAGDGRSLWDADIIWNEFRYLYHTFNSVKSIFAEVYGLDPDSEEEFPSHLKSIITGRNSDQPIQKFGAGANSSAVDEFAILLGSDYIGSLPDGSLNPVTKSATQESVTEAIEFVRKNWIDAPASEGGLVEYFNNIIVKQLQAVYNNFLAPEILREIIPGKESDSESQVEFDMNSLTPRQLFFLMVGIFRQRLWEDPYARAWLVLKPDRKRGFLGAGGGDDVDGYYSFRSVDKVFREFINPYNDLAKPSKRQKFLELLMATRSEGNSSTDIIVDVVEETTGFFERTIGPIWNAISDSLSGLMGMFKLNMQQMGYALSEVGNFAKQANILNKALNDSIYYSLGRPGSLLRAVDNPFTREYGEPVIEVREPFQRLHYLSSFSHILTNHIQENLNNVATVVTAVSDGKYPITVALDKGAPAERQVEKTVETGIYYDNMIGSGFTGFLHPLFHPLETFRGAAKNVQGTPDELSARRVALAHLKESIKDIYGGELMVIGNADIRPHDLVYIADIYERMYGLFEVEQVIHHFTPELGFITAITPNALVSVNDPARWYISSWFDSWMNVQTIRNDTRMYLDGIRSANSGISLGGDISMEALGEALNAQITGGLQFTHGSTALIKDLIANQTAQTLPGQKNQLIGQAKQGNESLSTFNIITAGLIGRVPVIGQLAWSAWKWVRDNVMDQHGCYVQYLNKNGQPMDAGLSYNQGMVVGRYHSKALLPGILGVRSRVRTPEGYAYIRSDDIFRSLGWQEKEIKDLVRYISYENALVHGRILKLAGLGPEKADLQQQFKVLCKVERVIDGDTIQVVDVLSSANAAFTIRFDGMNTKELNDIRGEIEYAEPNGDELSLIDISSPAGKAKVFTKRALENKLIIARIAPSRESNVVPVDESYDAGSLDNTFNNYLKDDFDNPRAIGTIFYYLPPEEIEKIKTSVASLLRNAIIGNDISVDEFKLLARTSLSDSSVFRIKFDQVYAAIEDIISENYFDYTNSTDSLSTISSALKSAFSIIVYMRMLESIYAKASEWPLTSWDEYYDNGYPVSLNWELVINNLATVYIKDLQRESDSVQSANELAAIPTRIGSS